MKKAVRAILIRDNKILVMRRNKYGSEYFTLVGGFVNEHETLEEALKREVREETGLELTASALVFTENNPDPYVSQYIYLCEVAPFDDVKLAAGSEEEELNKYGVNLHTPVWADITSLKTMAFRTPALQKALIDGLKKGFPAEPVNL